MPRPRHATTLQELRHALIGLAPCDWCVHSQTCAQQDLACAAFSQWVHSGKLPAREPTRAR